MRQAKSLLVDLFLIGLATLLALVLRDDLVFDNERGMLVLPYLGFSLLAALVIFPAAAVPSTLWRYSGRAEYIRLALTCSLVVGAAVAMSFATNRLDQVLRSVPLVQLLVMLPLLIGLRVAERAHRFRHVGRFDGVHTADSGETVLLLGTNAVAELYLQTVAEHGRGRVSIAGVFTGNDRRMHATFKSHAVLGTPEDISRIVRDLAERNVVVHRIVLTVPLGELSDFARNTLRDLNESLRLELDFFAERMGFSAPGKPVTGKATANMLELRTFPASGMPLAASLSRPYWKMKRCIDVVASGAVIAILLPVMLLIGLLTAISLGRPVLFWQQRPGRFGQPFKVFKFRSLLGAHDENGNRLPDDQRITAFGRFLRATRLDELPQLFNIFAGNMSLVGPRPLLDVDQLDDFRDRLTVRPGLTGWAQVNGGKRVSASDKMALDAWYIRNASLFLDLKIALLTVKMVVLGERQNPKAVEQAWREINRRPTETCREARPSIRLQA